jgi:hypothetical protein
MDAPWDDVFALMWEAYRAGTIPVGFRPKIRRG